MPLYRAKRDRDPNVRNAPMVGRKPIVGWRRVNTYFVDSSGFGTDREPAMTFKRFLNHVKLGRGYGIIDAGQFQVYIGEFVKVQKKKRKKR